MSEFHLPPVPQNNHEIRSIADAEARSDSVDSEIFPYFEQEALQAVLELEAELHLLDESTPAFRAVLTEMCRHFHTLKGSANSIGHYRIGALAHGMKVQTERLIQSEISSCPRGFSRLVLDFIPLIGELVLEVKDPVYSEVPPEKVLHLAEAIRSFENQPLRRCARLYLR